MKKLFRTFFMVVLLANYLTVSGQFPVPASPRLFTDRGLYISGENIYFTSFSPGNNEVPELSTVLYAEIITPRGSQIAGGKFSLIHGTANGCLSIPKGIVSGNYYFRVYTKYMRNEGADAFPTVPVKIVNPYSNEVALADTGVKNMGETVPISRDNTKTFLLVTTEKTTYRPRDTVRVQIAADSMGHRWFQNLCVAVVPEATEPNAMLPINPEALKQLTYYPETRGVSLTGRLIDSLAGKPISGATVNLSIIGKGSDFMAVNTDKKGRFFFALPPYSKTRDIFICASNTADQRPRILVDNDFASGQIQLPSPIFSLSEQERLQAYQMAVNEQLSTVFNNDTVGNEQVESRSRSVFYGTPSSVLKLDRYVELPSIEDYLNELPAMLKVRKRKGKKYFKILGTRPEMSFLDPLVLVDWVAIDNPKKILAIAPDNVDKIEIITVPYVKGDMHYGGIVSIVSKKGDFAGINLPSSGIFINYLFLNKACKSPDKSVSTPTSPRTQNTLYWNPDLSFNPDNKTDFSFILPDIPGSYSVVLQGIDLKGQSYYKTISFRSVQSR